MRAQAPSAYVNITDLRGQPLYLLYYKLIAAGHRELMLRILFCSTLSCTFNPIRASPVAFVASSGLVVTLLPFVLICVLSLTTVQPELTIEAQCSQKPKIPTKHAFIFEARGQLWYAQCVVQLVYVDSVSAQLLYDHLNPGRSSFHQCFKEHC
jgi:hypothetical protein